MTSNLNEARNDLDLTACSQGGTVSDADNVGAVHKNAKNAINENAINKNAIGILEAATSGNMSDMTTPGTGHMKAAAERIVIVFRGILMAEILCCARFQCDRLRAEIAVNNLMTSGRMMVEIVVIAVVMIGIVVMAIPGHEVEVAGGGIIDWVCPRSSCGLQPETRSCRPCASQ